jgi:DNA (cytosine-5)-methyltransferase 1
VTPLVVKAKTHGGGGNDAMAGREPLGTITASKRGEFAIAVPYLVHRSNGERVGQAPRIYDRSARSARSSRRARSTRCAPPSSPSTTATARPAAGTAAAGGSPMDTVTCAITTRSSPRTLSATTATGPAPSASPTSRSRSARSTSAPLRARRRVPRRYNGQSGQQPDEPIGTVDTTDRYGLVTVTIDGEEYAIVDIGMRMLTPRELFRAQGFADDYQIAPT